MNISVLVEKVLKDTGTPDPQLIADKIIDKVDPKEFLAVWLPQAVLHALGQLRKRAVSEDTQTRTVTGKAMAMRELVGGPSWVIHNGVENRMLSECTVDDLVGAAEAYSGRAAANERMAEKCRTLAASLKSRRVRTVGDLPAEFVTKVWQA